MHLDDAPAASAVSALAGERFRTVDEPRIAACADDPPFTSEELHVYIDAGRAWVAIEDTTVVGFVVVDLVDGNAHIEEVDVLPAAGGRGHGTRLIDAVDAWARSMGLSALTLTTFRDVTWNGPWYSRRGFRSVSDSELTPALRELRERENARGLPAELRVVMRRDVGERLAIQLPGQETLIACWTALAQLSRGARVLGSPGSVAAVFPAWAPLNNAIVADATARGATAVATEMTALYAGAGVDEWALWIPSSATEFDAPDELREVGSLTRDTTTLVMQASIPLGCRPHGRVVRTSIATLLRVSVDHPVDAGDLDAPDDVPGLAAWVMVVDELAVGTAWTFVHGTDCGIYAVETLPPWRRRGLARALLEHVLADARRRGARTATLQSTRMGQSLYESFGFEPAGRYEEWTPASRTAAYDVARALPS